MTPFGDPQHYDKTTARVNDIAFILHFLVSLIYDAYKNVTAWKEARSKANLVTIQTGWQCPKLKLQAQGLGIAIHPPQKKG